MASDNYQNCYNITLRWEGGYVNHPKDPGGATNRGVIQRVYDAYRTRKGLSRQSVKYIADSEVKEIYKNQYWDRVRGDELPHGVDLAVWDFGVNSGPSRSVKYLQRILGVRQDGVMGEVTLAAVEQRDPARLAAQLCDDRLAFVQRLSTWSTFGKGWGRRITAVKRLSADMAESEPLSEPDVRPPEPGQGKAEGPPAVTKQEGFWAKIGTILTGVGAGLASVLKGIPWQVGVAIVVIGGIGVAIYWLQTKDDET